MKRAKNKSNMDIVRGYLAGERPFIQVGYVGDDSTRKEGEIWEDSSGKTWIKKNGYKKRVNKLGKVSSESLKKICSVCSADVRWGSDLDDKIFPKTGRCYDCNVAFESKLKVQNKFENYEKIKVLQNQRGFCLDLKGKLEESINYLKTSSDDIVYLNEDGTKEVWKDTARAQVLSAAENDYKECLAAIDRINFSLSELEGQK